MVLQGWPWNDCEGTEKELLHCKFDILKTEVQHSTAALDHRIEKILQQIRVTGRARK
ncbi:MAG: DNA transformation protein [Paracoccaceae bacterium]|jgi:DNA transformation protein